MEDNVRRQRKYLRYRDPDTEFIRLKYTWSTGEESHFSALVANESLSGLACVYVGNEPCKANDVIQWLEYEGRETECQVIRCYPVEKDVYFLALRLSEVS